MKFFRFILALGIFLILCSMALAGQKQIDFKGVLTDQDEKPLSNTTVSIKFSIYDALVKGNMRWAEKHNVVTDTSGHFNIILGMLTPLTSHVFNDSARWLRAEIENEDIFPRCRISPEGFTIATGLSSNYILKNEFSVGDVSVADEGLTPEEVRKLKEMIKEWEKKK